MPSSTSNSEAIEYRALPNHPWLKLCGGALMILIVALTGWEWLARSLHHTPGTYDDNAATWTMERRKLDTTNEIKVVLTGSSRMLWAADLDILENELGTRPLQLALPGTSPQLIVQHVVEESDFTGLILVGYTPELFHDITPGYAGGSSLDYYKNESPSQRSGHFLYTHLSDYWGFLDEFNGLFRLLEVYSDLPVRKGSTDIYQDGKLGNTYADRQTEMWLPVELPGSLENVLITNFWAKDLDLPPLKDEGENSPIQQTNRLFADLLAKFRARGGDMVFVRMPSDGGYLERDLKNDVRGSLWEPLVLAIDATMINSMDYPQLSSDLNIPEWSHLSRTSQDLWSVAFVRILEQQYELQRGQTLSNYLESR